MKEVFSLFFILALVFTSCDERRAYLDIGPLGSCRVDGDCGSGMICDTSSLSCIEEEVVYNIGDTGPGDGWIFLTPDCEHNDTKKYFEVTAEDVAVGVPWSSTGGFITGALDAYKLGDGKPNTQAIIDMLGSDHNDGHYAAKKCYELGDGWFLPSKHELAAMYFNLQAPYVELPENFFTNDSYYWTSTEIGGNIVSGKNLHTGSSSDNIPKVVEELSVRCVRSF